MVQTILRAEQVIKSCGLPRSTLYRKIANGEFPKPIQLSERAVGWLETDIADLAASPYRRPRWSGGMTNSGIDNQTTDAVALQANGLHQLRATDSAALSSQPSSPIVDFLPLRHFERRTCARARHDAPSR